MKRSIHYVTINGKRWRIRFDPLAVIRAAWKGDKDRKIVAGDSNQDHRRIRCGAENDPLNTLLHEAVHSRCPDLDEECVEELSDLLTDMVRLWHRKMLGG